jgi:hypothetical protein
MNPEIDVTLWSVVREALIDECIDELDDLGNISRNQRGMGRRRYFEPTKVLFSSLDHLLRPR